MDELQKVNCTQAYQTKHRDTILVKYQEGIARLFSLVTAMGNQEINYYDVDKELKNLSAEEFTHLLPWLAITKFTNGDSSLKLKLELPGGMLSLRDSQNELRNIAGLTQLTNALDQQLLQVPVVQWNPVAKTAVKVGTAAAGGAVGGVLGAGGVVLGAIILGTNPVGWAIAAGAIGVGLVGGVAGWLFASHKIEASDQYARDVKQTFETIFQAFANIQLYSRDLQDPTLSVQRQLELKALISDTATRIRQSLRQSGFIHIGGHGLRFAFNDDTLEAIVTCYKEAKREDVLFSVKYLILVVMASLPQDDQVDVPIDSIIDNLITLVDGTVVNGIRVGGAPQSVDQAIKTACYVQIGKLYLASNRLRRAVEFFDRVLVDSDYYPIVQGILPRLRAAAGMQQPAIGNNNNNQ